MASPLDLVRSHADKAKIPLGGNRVYKDECVYSFDTPVCLRASSIFYACDEKHFPFNILTLSSRNRKMVCSFLWRLSSASAGSGWTCTTARQRSRCISASNVVESLWRCVAPNNNENGTFFFVLRYLYRCPHLLPSPMLLYFSSCFEEKELIVLFSIFFFFVYMFYFSFFYFILWWLLIFSVVVVVAVHFP